MGPLIPVRPGTNSKLPALAKKIDSCATVPVSFIPVGFPSTKIPSAFTPFDSASFNDTPNAPWVTSYFTDTTGVLSPATAVLSKSAS